MWLHIMLDLMPERTKYYLFKLDVIKKCAFSHTSLDICHHQTQLFARIQCARVFIVCTGGYAMFALTMLNAGANAFVLAVHPAFKPGGGLSPYDDPVAALTGTTLSQHVVGTTKEFLKSNPELMHEASNVGLELMRATVLEPKETVD